MKDFVVVNGRELSRANLTSLGRILCNLLPEVAEHVDVIVCTAKGDLSNDALGLFNHAQIRRVELRSGCTGWWGRITFYMWLYIYVWRTRPLWFWEINHALAPTPRCTSAIVTVHDFYPLYPELNKSRAKAFIFRVKLWLTWRTANLIIYPSNTTKEEAHSFFQVPLCGEIVLSNGVPSIKTCAIRALTGFPLNVGYLGRINYWKGVDRLLKHAMQCKAVHRVTLAGMIDKEFLESLGQGATGLLEKAELLGPISEESKSSFFESIDIFIYETRYDGFGIPPLEAMLYCVPTIVSDIPVMREVLKGHAIYIDLKSENPLEDAINSLYRMTPKEYANFICGAREYALSKNWVGAGATFVTELHKVAGSRGGAQLQ